jgi:hypothetical protein
MILPCEFAACVFSIMISEAVLPCCYSGVAEMISIALQWCCSGISVVLQWRYTV